MKIEYTAKLENGNIFKKIEFFSESEGKRMLAMLHQKGYQLQKNSDIIITRSGELEKYADTPDPERTREARERLKAKMQAKKLERKE